MKGTHVLIGCCIALAVFVIGAGAFVFVFGRTIMSKVSAVTKMPPQYNTAGVRTGSGLLSKSTFIKDPRLGEVTDIQLGKFDRARGTEIGIAGTSGAMFVDTKASIKAFTPLAGAFSNINFVDVERDGSCEYLNCGTWTSPPALTDHNGKPVWSFPKTVDDTTYGDINGDGKLEFAVGFNGGGGVTLLDARGKELWNRRDANVWHLEMADANSDGQLEIVHSNAGGEMIIRDAQGNVINNSKTAGYLSQFSLVNWPTKTSPPCCVSADDGAVRLYGFNGATMAQFTAASARQLGAARAALIKPKSSAPYYLAVLNFYKQWNRSVLYVFDSKKALVYEEVFDQPVQAIASVPLGKSGADSLLVGGRGVVLRYDLRAQAGAKP